MFVTTLFYAISQMDDLLEIHISPEPSPPSTPAVADFFAIPPISNNPSTQQQISQIRQNSILHSQLLNRIIELLSGTHFWTSTVRGKWSADRILQVFPGEDGLVQNVQAKTASGTYMRPITKICVIYPA